MIDKDDVRGVANRSVVASEFKTAGLTVHCKDGNIVGSLISTVKKPTSGIEAEAAWIIAACPFFANKREIAIRAHRKDADAVVESVARIDEFSVS
jgi:hypothetical protein